MRLVEPGRSHGLARTISGAVKPGLTGMTELVGKLGIKTGHLICLVDAPPDTAALLREACSPGVTVHDDPGDAPYDLIFLWPRALAGLAGRLQALLERIRPQGAIWIIMPKKKYARPRGVAFTWEEMQAAALQTDLVDNKIASISEQEYGTRFVIRKARRHLYAGGGGLNN